MSQRPVRPRFWVEAAAAIVTGAAAIATIVWPDWMELLFGLDPDGGNGTVELGVTLMIATVAMTLAIAARAEWRRTSRSPAHS